VSLRDAAYSIAIERVARACRERDGSDMNPYVLLGSRIGTPEAASLAERLAAWHDSMVAHERRLRIARTDDLCDDECPHVEARALWTEAVATFGDRAAELRFLRSRAITPAAAEANNLAPVAARADGADAERRSSLKHRVVIANSGRSSTARAEASQSRTVEI
jgi:hypothetical protein